VTIILQKNNTFRARTIINFIIIHFFRLQNYTNFSPLSFLTPNPYLPMEVTMQIIYSILFYFANISSITSYMSSISSSIFADVSIWICTITIFITCFACTVTDINLSLCRTTFTFCLKWLFRCYPKSPCNQSKVLTVLFLTAVVIPFVCNSFFLLNAFLAIPILVLISESHLTSFVIHAPSSTYSPAPSLAYLLLSSTSLIFYIYHTLVLYTLIFMSYFFAVSFSPSINLCISFSVFATTNLWSSANRTSFKWNALIWIPSYTSSIASPIISFTYTENRNRKSSIFQSLLALIVRQSHTFNKWKIFLNYLPVIEPKDIILSFLFLFVLVMCVVIFLLLELSLFGIHCLLKLSIA